MPKVSIIVPVYNAEKTLRRCLDSLINQTLKDIEIICIDNCSTDNSVAIIDEYCKKDYRVSLYLQPVNKGQARSMNTGLVLAIGKYVAECDSDDYVEPNMYEILYNETEGSEVVQCGWIDEFPNGKVVRSAVNKKVILYPMKAFKGKMRCSFLIGQPMIPSAIYDREWLLENELMYREGYNFEDTALAFKIRTTAKRYAIIPDCLYHYSKQVEGSGTKTIDDMQGGFEQYEEIEKWNATHNLKLDSEIAVMKYYTYRWCASRAKTKEDKDEFWKKASKEFQKVHAPSEYFINHDDYLDYCKYKDI